jgi:hypothetical protein
VSLDVAIFVYVVHFAALSYPLAPVTFTNWLSSLSGVADVRGNQ